MTLAIAPRRPCARATVLLVSALAALANGHGGAADSASSPTALHYRLSFDEARQRVMQVDLLLPAVAGPVELVMSRASPGRYALHEFATNVFDLQATDGAGKAVPVEHPVPHRWIVRKHDGAIRVRYRVYGDRVDGTYLAVDTTHAHINIPAALVWASGLEDRPAIVEIVPPAGCGMLNALTTSVATRSCEVPAWRYMRFG